MTVLCIIDNFILRRMRTAPWSIRPHLFQGKSSLLWIVYKNAAALFHGKCRISIHV